MMQHKILPQDSLESGASSPDNNGQRSRTVSSRAKKMACVECRQQKSKCDAQDRHPNPCTRCVKKKIQCSLQSDYKRTYKRAKFQQIEEELEELKKNLSQAGVDNLLKQLQERKYQPHELNSPTPPAGVVPPPPQNTAIPGSQLPPLRSALGTTSPYQQSPPVHPQFSQHPPVQPHQAQSPVVHQITDEPQSAFQRPQSRATPTDQAQGPSIIREASPSSPSANMSNLQTNAELTVDLSEDVLRCSAKRFGEVELSPAQIRELFIEFVNKYHRFLPIVDVSKGPERIYRLCPVLFWTIASISLRHLSTDILMSLAPLLKTALAEITISPITRYFPNESEEPILNVSSVYSVQALLLYTYWPPLTSSLSADSSWNTVGIAIFQAIRIGLNGPGTTNYHVQQQSQQTESTKILQEHNKTWIACNIVSQTIATSFGFPAFVSFDSSVIGSVRTGKQTGLPTCIRQMVEISHFEDQVAKVLNSNTVDAMGLADPTERLPLLKVLGQQLNELEAKLVSEGVDDIRKFHLLSTRVHLLTYFFLDNTRLANFELRRGLVLVFNAACALLSHASSMSAKDPKFFKYVPGMFVLQIWQSSCIVAKLVHSPLNDVVDIGAGRQLYISAMQLANKASILKHDMAYRSAGIMRNTWQLLKLLREKHDRTNWGVTVRSRMSASVFFDCLWLLREQIGMIKLDPQKRENSGDASHIEDDESLEEEDDDEEEEVLGDKSQQGVAGDPGTANSEGSMKSTTSSQRSKRARALSNNFDAEKSARKLIRTVPLDPVPIALKRQMEESSPRPTISSILQKQSPDSSSTSSVSRSYPRPHSINNHPLNNNLVNIDGFQGGVSPTNIPSLDLSDDWTSDMLWKDVDSVMNDFGFSTDDIPKVIQSNGGPVAPATGQSEFSPAYKQGSLFGNYNRK
ncbi:Regulatory protein LEU3 [Cyberlindnera fabianii]|uniref:Regulatory protein LEU3 n=1 Tax=Cyberlindnera fabianii TaxID=36022 RepID=A0A1V2L0X8_CYBFA|nr:Regulatory protein LEU3 [Cyberlindnera fabianii]